MWAKAAQATKRQKAGGLCGLADSKNNKLDTKPARLVYPSCLKLSLPFALILSLPFALILSNQRVGRFINR
jgi:hypothetical protein